MWLQQKIVPKDLILLPAIFARALGLGNITREGYHLFKRAKSHGLRLQSAVKKEKAITSDHGGVWLCWSTNNEAFDVKDY